MLRGTSIGAILGVLPGGGPTLGAFSAYTLEKKISRTPQMFGKGAVEGVAAPESANNAASGTGCSKSPTLNRSPSADPSAEPMTESPSTAASDHIECP